MRLETEPVTASKGRQDFGKRCGSHPEEQEDKREQQLKEGLYRDRDRDKGQLWPHPAFFTWSSTRHPAQGAVPQCRKGQVGFSACRHPAKTTGVRAIGRPHPASQMSPQNRESQEVFWSCEREHSLPSPPPLPANRSTTITPLLNVEGFQGYSYMTDSRGKLKPVFLRTPSFRAVGNKVLRKIYPGTGCGESPGRKGQPFLPRAAWRG